MWKVDGDYAFHAVRSGASSVTGVDIDPATPRFEEKNAAVGNPVRFVQADVNDSHIAERTGGPFDVVFCSGVLYHVPDPVHTLRQLRRLCREHLILTTASITERDGAPQAAVFLPFLDDEQRTTLSYSPKPGRKKVGLDEPFRPERGYVNWFWLPTPSCITAMVRFAGFQVLQMRAHRRVTTVLARAAG
jgi:SAM-dependent methyltransferase